MVPAKTPAWSWGNILQFADAWKEPNADRTYIFVASEHFTTHAHELLADYVRKQISPGVAGS